MFHLVGKPYAFPSHPPESFDCWTLVKYVRELVILPCPLPFRDDEAWCTPAGMARALAEARPHWKPRIGGPERGDMAVFNNEHVGVFWDGGVLHALAHNASVVWTSGPVLRRAFPKIEWWH
jgi:cell wall-associated NlpC family hydrolase